MPQLSHSRAVSPSEAATPGKPIPRHAADAHRLVLPKRGRAEPPAGSCTLNIGPALSRRYALDLRPTFGTRGPQSSDGGSGLREVQSCGKKKERTASSPLWWKIPAIPTFALLALSLALQA